MSIRVLIILSFFLLTISCKFDQSKGEVVMAEFLEGDWQVIKATRNNRPALSLENAEFYITKDSFSTNFLPDTMPHPYSFDGKTLKLISDTPSEFEVRRKIADTLTLTTIIKNFEFVFEIVPKPKEEDDF
jgi:hypothetical protein